MEKGEGQLDLRQALLIYAEDQTQKPRAVVTLHPVTKVGERPVIGPGQLLQFSQLEALVQSLQAQETARILIPPELLFADSSTLLWWHPQCAREIYFSTADQEFNRDVNRKKVAHPALLFKVTPGMLWVYALANNERPSAKTVVRVAPYCNLYKNGSMCRGDINLPAAIIPSTIPTWEAIFYDSRFTHTNLHGQKMTKHKGGHHGLWREMVGAQVFDSKYLVATKLTVGDILAGKTEP